MLASIAGDGQCSFLTGRAVHVGADGDRVGLEYEGADGVVAEPYDFVVNCTGFDLLAQVRGLFDEGLRAEVERLAGPLWDRPPQTEVPIGRALELAGMEPRLHIPGLGGLSQGPGFANLGSLGLLANRVLQPYLPGLAAEARSSAAQISPDRIGEELGCRCQQAAGGRVSRLSWRYLRSPWGRSPGAGARTTVTVTQLWRRRLPGRRPRQHARGQGGRSTAARSNR